MHKGIWTFLGAFVLAATTTAVAGHRKDSSISMHLDDAEGRVDCSNVEITFDGRKAAITEEQLNVQGGTLDVSSAGRVGVYVQGGTGKGYAVRLCKGATSPALASSVRPSLAGRKLTITTPDDDEEWAAYLIVDAPADASMKIATDHAPIELSGVRGTFAASANNGPVSIKNASATIDASTVNGPVSVSGSQGDVKLRAQNGPLSVKLDSPAWQGKGLDARTQNGPLTIEVGKNYRSGILVEASDHSPYKCKGEICKSTHLSGDDADGKRFVIGSSPTLVHLSTVNGPVMIKSID